MRRYLVTSIVAISAFLGGLGVQSFMGGDATAGPRPTRTYRCVSQLAVMSIRAFNPSTKPATIRNVVGIDVGDNTVDLPDVTIPPRGTLVLLDESVYVAWEAKTKSKLLLHGTAEVLSDLDSKHMVRCT